MKSNNFTVFGWHRLIGVALLATLVVALTWTTAAHAQTAHAQRPIDVQHEEPKAPSGPALGASGVPAGDDGAAGSADGSQPASSKARVLFPMGGVMLLIYAGAFVASGIGLVLLRRPGRDG
jgi:hypothetical protein